MATDRFFSRTAFVIWIGSLIGALCVMPYVIALTPDAMESAAKHLGVPVFAVIAISLGQSALMLVVMSYLGLWAARKLGMGAPLLDAWLGGAARPSDVGRGALTAIALGLASGVVLVALDALVFLPLSPSGVGHLVRQPQPQPLIGFLASFEGGITEEVELRLFLLSLLALGIKYAVGLLRRDRGVPLTGGIFWSANIVAAILFGLGHLPLTARLVTLTPIIVVRAIVLNGIVGVIAGFLFRRRGIEMAMLCHFSADLILHVVLPPLIPVLWGGSH